MPRLSKRQAREESDLQLLSSNISTPTPPSPAKSPPPPLETVKKGEEEEEKGDEEEEEEEAEVTGGKKAGNAFAAVSDNATAQIGGL